MNSLNTIARQVMGPQKNWTLHRAIKKRSDAKVIFTHHFQGNEKSLRRHVALVNQLGFEAITFNFSWHGLGTPVTIAKSLHQAWKKDILSVVSEHPGPLIFFSFSGPAAASVQAVGDLLQNDSKRVLGMIFDSGPFWDLELCYENLLREYYGVKNAMIRSLLLQPLSKLLNRNHQLDIKQAFEKIVVNRSNLPILSIRGQNDTLVPSRQIDLVFEMRGLLNVKTLDLTAGHLTGIKEFPAVYESVVSGFLSQFIRS